jgi:hypothetical protein
LIASTAFAYRGVALYFQPSNFDRTYLFDLAIGGAGVEVVKLANILCAISDAGAGEFVGPVFIPYNIASGSRIAARCQDSAGGGSIVVSVVGIAALTNMPSFSVAETLGASTATSKGTQVDPGGSAGTKGAYAELVASSAAAALWAVCIAAEDGTSLSGDLRVDLATGTAASEVVEIADAVISKVAEYRVFGAVSFSGPVSIAASTRITARCQSTNATAGSRELGLVAILLGTSVGAGAAGGGGLRLAGHGGLAA